MKQANQTHGRLYVDIKTFKRFTAACREDGRKIEWQAKHVLDEWLSKRKLESAKAS